MKRLFRGDSTKCVNYGASVTEQKDQVETKRKYLTSLKNAFINSINCQHQICTERAFHLVNIIFVRKTTKIIQQSSGSI